MTHSVSGPDSIGWTRSWEGRAAILLAMKITWIVSHSRNSPDPIQISKSEVSLSPRLAFDGTSIARDRCLISPG